MGWPRSGQVIGQGGHTGIFKLTGSPSVEQFRGDSYFNIQKPSEGLPMAHERAGEVSEEEIQVSTTDTNSTE